MSTHSLGHQFSGFGFATSLSGTPKKHGPTSNLGKKNFFLQVSTNPSPYLREKYQLNFHKLCCRGVFGDISWITNELGDPPFDQLIAFSVLPLASSHYGSLGCKVLLREIDRLHIPERRAVHVVSTTRLVKLGNLKDSISYSF
ncbi:hypothetical protein H5410_056673 [Solanum commersonii]|uniref:Uncharacterized protein n=1 Tax=Solanum commersonii TaxID=4109 RepID=A0A9J5WKX6_SOLCO|nr:hypothetical protein H5410_056673 [Solanum commersonii]